jgi:type IV pilus biogenesis protein CpaD/CtpE
MGDVFTPADLMGPRNQPPRVAERRDEVWRLYVKG